MTVGIYQALASRSSETHPRADPSTSFSMRVSSKDSGLAVDAQRTVADGVTRLAGPDMSVLVITHYPHILEYLKPDRVHVLHHGRLVTSGGPELATQIEREGYEPIIGPVAAEAGASRTSLTGVVAEAQA
jgi:ABC-type multidrug transport system ATPase subunit